jgi:predicted amidohydrolase YtcJ
VGHVKFFADGALGPRTAWMIAPYEGEPNNRGIPVYGPSELEALVERAASHGLACAIHAIGDQANRVTLNAFEQIQNHRSNIPNRIEHVQLLHPKDLPRLARLGIVASMQPIHATQDMEMADRYWGERSALSYAWRSLLGNGTVLAFGSDCPVEDLNPFVGIHAAVTRRRADGAPDPEGWYAEQRLTVSEAVHAYTLGAARAAGVAHRLGSLSPGRIADLIVLDRDIFETKPDEILGTRPLGTMIEGRWVHRQKELA